jgi:hypothetical protein
VTAAIFGLLGVVIGGVLNGVIAWRLELARSGRAGRAGARLVSSELRQIAREYSSVDLGRRPDVAELPSTAWENHRALLAEVLKADEFQMVSSAYADAASWRSGASLIRPEMDEQLAALFESSADLAKAAVSALKPMTADPSPFWRSRRSS